MVGFLPPLVQEAPLSGSIIVLLYGFASAATGAALGAAYGYAGSVLIPVAARPAALSVLASLALASAALDGRQRAPWILQRRRQVPESWLFNYGPVRASILYGASMGSGLVTFITVAGFYPVMGWALMRGPAAGAQIMGFYGAAQAVPVLLAGWAQLRGRRQPVDGSALSQPAMRRAAAAAAAALAVMVLWSLW